MVNNVKFINYNELCCISKYHASEVLVSTKKTYFVLHFRGEKLSDIISGLNGSNRIVRPEFRDALDKMGFPMEDSEFDKLWAK